MNWCKSEDLLHVSMQVLHEVDGLPELRKSMLLLQSKSFKFVP